MIVGSKASAPGERRRRGAVEHGADGDSRRLLDQHDAGAVERHHPAQAIEQRRQHRFAIETAGERHRRLTQ
jgi:hypothetical protein